MSFDNVKTVGIIGAGVSGLTAAKILLAEGFHCTVFERHDKLGGVWADGYLNFGVQVQKELYEFPDWPLPPDTPNFTPGPIFQKYLTDYAENFDVFPHIRFRAEVTRVSKRAGDTPGWRIAYRGGDAENTEEFDLVVVCIGTFSQQPKIPDIPGRSTFTGKVIHSSELNTPDQLTGNSVVVVGYGKSATDAAIEAAEAAKTANIVVRTPHWPIPRKLAGILPFKWGLLQRMTGTLLPLHMHPTALERILHSIGKPLVWLFWRLTEVLLYFQCRLGARSGAGDSLVSPVPLEVSGFNVATMVPRPRLYELIRRGSITAYQGEIDYFDGDAVTLRDGRQIGADLVIFGTGWRTDYGFLGEEVCKKLNIEDDGFYLYRHLVHPDVDNLVFLGCNAITYEAIVTYNLQARWLAELLKGTHNLPAAEAMHQQIDETKAWKRSWMPNNGGRAAMLGPHHMHYHDDLLRDFGANPKRKKGFFAPLKELIQPYEAKDYASIVSGAWQSEELRLH